MQVENRKPIRVLVKTSILPIWEVGHKKDENDVILSTGIKMEEKYNNIEFKYIYVFPRVNYVLSKISSKWKSYYGLQKKRQSYSKNILIETMGILMFPKSEILQSIFYKVSFWLNRRQINRIITSFQPTIIHAHNVQADAFLSRMISNKFNIPYLITLRELKSKNFKLVKWVLDGAKELIALSPIQKDEVQALTMKNVITIPHGVDESFYKEPIKSDSLTILKLMVVCRLIKLKNILLIIHSLSKIEEDFVFDIYGEGPEKENIEALIVDLKLENKIFLKGYVDNKSLSRVYPSYDVFIMPSFPEALGRVYFEAMANGVPIVAAKGTGVDGIVVDGIQGFLVELKVANSLQVCLENLFANRNKLEQMRLNAYLLARQFSWDEILKKIYDVYK